jgi:glucose/arabinose dehydrogenase
MDGLEQPIYYWVPSIAPSGMAFYTGDLFPEWRGNLFVGAMAGRHLARLVLDGERVVAEEKLLEELDTRIREVRQGPDGALYVLATNSLLRLVPRR